MEPFELDAGNTAWMLASASLVLLMTPALAFFYGGMTRSKTVLNMMMMSFGALAVVGPIWMLWGYSETFGTNIAGIIGNPFEYFALHGLTDDGSLMAATGVPATVAVGYQATFAIITVALISGAIADRAKFGTWLVFCRHLGHPGLRPDRAHGVGRRRAQRRRLRRRVAVHPDRLRRWHRRAHQRRYGRLHAGAHHRQAQGLRQGPDEAAQPAVRHARCGHAVVRLVRLQRRLRVRR